MKHQTIVKTTFFLVLLSGLFSCSQPLGEEDVRQLLVDKELYAKSYSWSSVAVNDSAAGFANQFSLSLDSTLVYDAASGLTWQQAGSRVEMTFAETKSYIDNLNLVRLAGFNDWRLPTLEEATTLMEPQKKNWVHINPMFDNYQRWVWSSSKLDNEHIWRVYYGNGNCEPLSAQRYQYVRAVRTGVEKKVNLTETIYDRKFALNQFAKIPAGSFLMGSVDDSADTDEQPVHRVRISREFYMGRYEVTQSQWQVVMGNNPSFFQGDSLPVEQVSWNKVLEFIGKLNGAAGRLAFRLPTEAEWEYACRAETITPFYTGENLTTDQTNYDGDFPYRSFTKGEYRGQTTPIGSFGANSWGLYDMHGNVWEWCSDWYEADSYQQFADKIAVDPQGSPNGSFRVIRGGGWSYDAQYCRSAGRGRSTPVNRLNFVGFRLVFVP